MKQEHSQEVAKCRDEYNVEKAYVNALKSSRKKKVQELQVVCVCVCTHACVCVYACTYVMDMYMHVYMFHCVHVFVLFL